MKKNNYHLAIFLILISIQFVSAQSRLTETEAEPYLGKYKIETNTIEAQGEVYFENQNLIFFTEGVPQVKLLQLPEYDRFKADKFDVLLQFVRDDFKEIIAVKIFFQGQEFLAKKIE